MLPKRLFSPKIVSTICLVNKSNFSITHIMMFVILKLSVKWHLLDGISFNKILMGWLIIVKSRSKTFSTTRVLFRTCFTWKKIHNIAGTTVQVIRLNATFSFGTERSKCFGSHNMFAYFGPSTSTWSATAFLLFKRCYFCSHKNVFQTFSSSNPIVEILWKTLPYSLSSVSSKCISDSKFLSFKNNGW